MVGYEGPELVILRVTSAFPMTALLIAIAATGFVAAGKVKRSGGNGAQAKLAAVGDLALGVSVSATAFLTSTYMWVVMSSSYPNSSSLAAMNLVYSLISFALLLACAALWLIGAILSKRNGKLDTMLLVAAIAMFAHVLIDAISFFAMSSLQSGLFAAGSSIQEVSVIMSVIWIVLALPYSAAFVLRGISLIAAAKSVPANQANMR
jgi:hypothetical protein